MQWPTHPRELGLVTTAEAVMPVELGGLGMTARGVEWAVTSGKWQRLHRGVVVMHAGEVDWLTRGWSCAVGVWTRRRPARSVGSGDPRAAPDAWREWAARTISRTHPRGRVESATAPTPARRHRDAL